MDNRSSAGAGAGQAGGGPQGFRCPICGGEKAQRRSGPLVQCSTCGLLCTDPAYVVPPDAMYDESYYTERTPYLQGDALFLRMFGRMCDNIQQYKTGGRLLDVGCGVGQLLQVAQARGFAVQGCDISPWASQYARDKGYDVRTGVLEELAYPQRAFDVVTASHTLEHVPEPVPFLQEMNRILTDDGLLVIAVPNIASVMAAFMGNRWAGLKPEQHLWHFTPQTLRALLARAGFRTLKVSSDPYLHHHPNTIKNAVLVAVSGFGSAIGRSDYMTAYAVKQTAKQAVKQAAKQDAQTA